MAYSINQDRLNLDALAQTGLVYASILQLLCMESVRDLTMNIQFLCKAPNELRFCKSHGAIFLLFYFYSTNQKNVYLK